MNEEIKRVEQEIATIILSCGLVGLALIIIAGVILIVIYCKQLRDSDQNDNEGRTKNNPFNINKKNKEHFEFRTLQNSTNPVVKENSLSECRDGNINVDLNSVKDKGKDGMAISLKSSHLSNDNDGVKKRDGISYRSNDSNNENDDSVNDSKDIENEIENEMKKYIPNHV